jgi:hypothetical protein
MPFYESSAVRLQFQGDIEDEMQRKFTALIYKPTNRFMVPTLQDSEAPRRWNLRLRAAERNFKRLSRNFVRKNKLQKFLSLGPAD